MRYEDASGTFQASGPIANDDSDTLTAGARGPATGNLITGEGTQYASAGADSAAGAHVTAIAGKGGEDSSFAGGKLSVSGEFGQLSVDAEGNYSYLANTGAPENVRDRFVYTLADSQGNSDTAALVVEIGKTPVVIKADAQQIVPGPDGVVTLPPGVELSDIMVVGRNLVVNLPDGTQLVIVDGAVFVPQLVLGGVEVPATNVAALLIGQEVQPAAGEALPSSGGNFALPPPPLDPGIPLGDLIPPTVYDYIPPEPQEVLETIDRDPEITIQPDGQPASVAAADEVDEAGLPGRDGDLLGEPEGSGEEAAAGDDGDPSEATGGTIIIDSPDGVDSVTINGILVTGVIGQPIPGAFGTLTITGFDGNNILYSYVLDDNIDHSDADPDQDDFLVELTDDDGDTATATLTIDIIDDVPTARNDVDSVTEGGPTVADGNVLTGSGGTDANATDGVADTTGADDAELEGFSQGGTAGTLGAPFAADHGTLVLNADGSYTYTLDSEDPEVRALADGETLTEVFNYTIVDGDGDPSNATLTITIVGTNDAPVIGNAAETVSEEGLQNGIIDDVGVPSDDTNSATESGTMSVSDPDGDPVTVTLGVPEASLFSNSVPVVWAVSNGGHTLTGSAGGNPVITITIDNDGNYNVNLLGPIDHPSEGVEDELSITIPVTADDGAETSNATLTVTIEDDSPSIEAGEVEPQLLVDESDLTVNETQSFGDVFTALFGGDGGDADSTEYELNINAGATGIADTATGEAVILVMNNGVVEGRTAVSDELVFTVTVNDDGDVIVDQLRAVIHPDDGNPDDPISLANDDLITLTATVTDNDGDTDSATIGIGNNVVLEDDGPTATDDVGNQAGEDQPITVDVLANDAAGADDVDDADVSYVDGTLTGSGQLVYNGDGTFTYTPAPGETGDILFDYQILDGDNDPSVATVTIHLGDDSTPDVGTPENLEVDEDGFAFANDDEGQVNPTETDHGENLTDSGNVVVDFGNDVPGAPLADSIVLVDSGALDGQLVDLDGNPVTFALNGSGQLVGTANSVQVMIISISGAVAGPGAGEVTYTYSAQLLQPVQHADVGNTENSDLLSGVGFQVTDSDGDTDTGSFNVTVWDDVPSAEDIEANQPSEDANVVVSIVSSITEGADGVDLADVTFSDHDGAGSLSYNSATGEFTYDPAAGEEGDVSFTYTIVDGDGDQITKEITIHLGDDATPDVGTPQNVTVDEDGLAGANVDSAPLQSDPGETNSTENETGTGQVVVDFGNDVPAAPLADSIELIDSPALDGQLVDLDGNPVTFTLNGSGQLVGTANGVQVMIISISGAVAGPGAGEVTYTYQAELLQPIQHADAGNNENTDILSGVQFQVTDSDGDTDTGSFNVTVVDDVPSSTVDADVTVPTLTLDETRPTGQDADSGDNAPGGLASVTAGFASNFEAAEYGADGPGTTEYSLELSAPGAGSGLFALDPADVTAGDSDGIGQGAEILLFANPDGSVSGRLTALGPAYFTISVDASGQVTFTQHLNVWHANTGSDDDTSSLSADAETLQLVQSVTDADGDTATAAIDLSDGVFNIEDDGPSMTINAPTINGLTATGTHTLDIGTDQFPVGTALDTFVNLALTGGTVGTGPGQQAIAITDFSLASNTAASLSYTFEFTYDSDPGAGTSTVTNTGTITFNSNGTYSVTIDDPVGYSQTVQTGLLPDDAFTHYDNVDNPGVSSGSEVTVAELTSTFFVQFSGYHNGFAYSAGADDVFSGNDSYVSASNEENGVASDTIQQNDILELNFYTTDPGGDLSDPAATLAMADGIFFQIDGFGNDEDGLVVLKLVDPADPDTIIYRTFQANNDDFFTNADPQPAGYTFNLDQNDAVLIIEANDYRLPSDPVDYVIVGLQYVVSSEGTSGMAFDLNGAVGDTGGIVDTSANAFVDNDVTDDNDVTKITNIGFKLTTSSAEPVTLNFTVNATDADGDATGSTALNVTFPASSSEDAQALSTLAFGVEFADSSFSSLAFGAENEQLQKSAANSNSLTIAAAVAAAGMAESAAASPPVDDQSFQVESESSVSNQQFDMQLVDGGDGAGSSISGLAEIEADAAPGKSASRGRGDEHRSDNSIDAASTQQAPDDNSSHQAANDQGPAASQAAVSNAVAPDVAMVSAEMLLAAGLTGETGKHNMVEEILVDALGQGGAPTVDGLLAQLPGGLGELAAIANAASPAAGGVPGWDMAMHGGSGFAAEVLTKLDAAMLQHHDAVQPVING